MLQQPKYKYLADIIRQAIADELYAPGDRIETENELAVRHNMSRQTVRQALDVLSAEGLIVRRRGSGTFVQQVKRLEGRCMRVGVITTYITEYIFPSILRGMEAELSACGYAMELSATGNRVDAERRILLEYLKKPVDGLIVEGTKTALPNPNLSIYSEFASRNIPVVFINGYYRDLDGCVYVVMDDERGGADAARFLLSQGHHAVGGVFKSDDMQGHERYAGFMRALTEAGEVVQDDAIVWFSTESRDALTMGKGAEALLESLSGCTGMVCYNDIVASRLLGAMSRMGVAMPEDLALASFDNSDYAGLDKNGIPSLGHAKERLGRIAVQKILRMIGGETEKPTVLPWKEMGR